VNLVAGHHHYDHIGSCNDFALENRHSRSYPPNLTNVHRHKKNSGSKPSQDSCESTLQSEIQWPEETSFRWSGSTGSLAGHHLLKKWLDACLAQHEYCRATRAGGFRPTRLIDLQAFGEAEDVRVVPGHSTCGEYVTLSYCWGGTSPLVLEPDTYENLHTQIQWEKVPQTMIDAIIVFTEGLECATCG
jgi:hypothetical protein